MEGTERAELLTRQRLYSKALFQTINKLLYYKDSNHQNEEKSRKKNFASDLSNRRLLSKYVKQTKLKTV